MRLSVFGLGYVGCVSAACFAKEGHEVVGVDVNPTKVEIINDGRSPIVEPGMDELIAEVVAAGRLRATTAAKEAIESSDVSLVCVGTPSAPNGSLNLTYVKRVCEEIGAAIEGKSRPHTVVIRSTMLPGTIEGVVVPTLEIYSGKKVGRDIGICINPEFLREGSSLADFYSPPFTLIGADDEETARMVSRLYARIEAPLFVTSIKSAEMVKYACNCFHALKVSFANEIGNICKALGIDSHEVMEIFCRDTKLNLSPYYLKPGFAFGGSCLPKDLRAIMYKAKELDVEAPVLSAILPSNRLQVERAVEMVLRTGKKRIGVLGMSFKAGTDDLRESPMVALIETLIGKGLQLAIYDKDVSLARLFGANKEYIEREIPHISKLMRNDLKEVIDEAEVIVVGNRSPEFREIEKMRRDGQKIIDLVRLFEEKKSGDWYEGICW
ncbi:nucleotide sugar dehydrogenase [Pyrinomonas methylaliphatogenes]|uniref:UDP-glucose 6-dehydrogenase n=1 Tax=Pyrinomonas methylaliphatogenes TaxID=454194 RepID=A0A0B6WYR5_9BACT|nr:UDP-glucose/GDP-mannose dehydrogenase family protein [Pyrinomonas methylaliphatogenes]CDM66241.1 nucleotide sugar dehydrogenase [Pyrinomonas methylaliphatogenes]